MRFVISLSTQVSLLSLVVSDIKGRHALNLHLAGASPSSRICRFPTQPLVPRGIVVYVLSDLKQFLPLLSKKWLDDSQSASKDKNHEALRWKYFAVTQVAIQDFIYNQLQFKAHKKVTNQYSEKIWKKRKSECFKWVFFKKINKKKRFSIKVMERYVSVKGIFLWNNLNKHKYGNIDQYLPLKEQ